MSELVNKSEVLDIWNNYWITDMTTLDAEDQLRELATVELKSAPQLNDNQQIVLDWLKEKMTKESRGRGFEFALWWLLDDFGTDELSNPTTTLFGRMNDKQRKEVLSAFIAWALEQEEAG